MFGLGNLGSMGSIGKAGGVNIGPELITNGDFSSAAGWTLPTGWTISSGLLNGTSAAFAQARRTDLNIPPSSLVRVSFDLVLTSGSIRPFVAWFAGGASADNGSNIAASGHYSFDFTTVSNGASTVAGIFQTAAGFVGTVDNFSVKKIG